MAVFYGTAGADNTTATAGGVATLYRGTSLSPFSGTGNDTLGGNDLADLIYGGDGNDLLDGGTGNDVVYGDAGDDQIYGSAGNDALYGGAGINVASYLFTSSPVV